MRLRQPILRIAALAMAFAAAASLSYAQPLPQPVLHWSFEDPLEASSAIDTVGGVPMSLESGSLERSGYLGNSLFLPRGAPALASGTSSFASGQNWTISFWYRQRNQADGGSRLRVMASFGIGGTFLPGISIAAERGNGSNIQFRHGAEERYFPFEWGLGWHHAAMVRDGAEIRCYLDGVHVGTFPAGSPTLSDLRLGGDSGLDTSRRFRGSIDEVKVFDASLSSAQIAALRGMHPLPPEVSIPYTSGFAGGDTPYHCFRIPSVLVAADGTVLAFAEGRIGNCSDTGNIDMVVRRSYDGGRTWGPIQVVWDDGPNTAGNPNPLLDRDTGRIWMVMTRNLGQDTQSQIQDGTSDGGRTVWVTYSDDHGANWVQPYEITGSVKEPDWRWYATGPGVSIQTADGAFIVPSTKNTGSGESLAFSFAIRSFDHGITWARGALAGPRISEAQAVELSDGRLMMNTRRVGSAPLFRAVATSTNQGATWGAVAFDPELPSSGVQGSILRYTLASAQDADRILFSNPADNSSSAASARIRMTVRVSLDEGESWTYDRELHTGPSAYSCLAVLDDFRIGNLYEWGDDVRYERIVFEAMDLEWLTRGAEPAPAVPLPPAAVSAEHQGGAVLVSWTPSVGAGDHHVHRYRMGAPGSGQRIATVGGADSEFLDESALAGTGYYYRVVAANGAGESATSVVAFASTRGDEAWAVPCRLPTLSGAAVFAPDGADVRVRSDYRDPSHGVVLEDRSLVVRSFDASYDQPEPGAQWHGQAGEDSGIGALAIVRNGSLSIQGFSSIANTNGGGILLGDGGSLDASHCVFEGFLDPFLPAVATEDGAADASVALSDTEILGAGRGVWLRNITGGSNALLERVAIPDPASHAIEFRAGPGTHSLVVRESQFSSAVDQPIRLYAFAATGGQSTRNDVRFERSTFANRGAAQPVLLVGGVEESASPDSYLRIELVNNLIDLRQAVGIAEASAVLALPETTRRSEVSMAHCTVLLGHPQQSALFLRTPASTWSAVNTIVDGPGIAFRNNNAGTIEADWSLLNTTTAASGAGTTVLGANILVGVPPLFADLPGGDFTLLEGSPAIAAGIESDVATDLPGNPRPDPPGSKPDLGAFESPFGGDPTRVPGWHDHPF